MDRPEPTRIEPVYYPRIWGARSLAPFFPEKTNLPEPIGEAWLTALNCRIATGHFTGKTLGEAWRAMSPEWRGTRFPPDADFPILVKFIFPNDKLSIQVHPDDGYAAAREQTAGGRGKTEMWHAVSAEPGAKVFVGLKPGVTKERFVAALADHRLEDLFQSYEVHAGDTFFVPAGTPHTIGPGLVLCEAQEYSDLTYRIYDYGRVDGHGKPRQLHVDKAVTVINFAGSLGGRVAPVTLTAPRSNRKLLAACRYFATERWEFSATVESESDRTRFELFVVIDGSGYIHSKAPPILYGRGHCWLIPASLGQFSLQPEQGTTVLRSYVPDLSDLAAELQASGVSGTQLSNSVFA